MPDNRLRPVKLVAVEERDAYFEKLIDEEPTEWVLKEVPFLASTGLLLDPIAYQDVRRQVLGDVRQAIDEALSEVSRERLDAVMDHAKAGRVRPFVGAGVGVPAGYPTWRGFLETVAKGRVEETALADFLKLGDLEGLAQAIVDAAGLEYFEERLSKFSFKNVIPDSVYAICQTFSGDILTTNVDPLLEVCARELGYDVDVVRGCGHWEGRAAAASAGRERILLKLHGDYKIVNSRVFLFDEYERAYAAHGATRRDLRQYFEHDVLLFIGCSLGLDRTMEVALQVATEKNHEAPRHFALLPTDGREDAERDRYLNERRIFPIWYLSEGGDHSVLDLILWSLKCAVVDGI